MRTREKIEKEDVEANDYAVTIRLSLEVLLDIRDLLMKQAL